MKDVFLVSFGAVLGANTRFMIFNKLQRRNIDNDLIILIINTLASFSLGFSLSILQHISSLNLSDQIVLFFLIGFIGSLSTFSTFVYDLFDLLLKNKFSRATKLFLFSSCFGLTAMVIGFLLGNQ